MNQEPQTERVFFAPMSSCTYSMFGPPSIPFEALADGFHYLRGFGHGEKVGDKFYTSEQVYYPMGSVERSDWFIGEKVRYSQWTDEQRAEERARKQREAEEAEMERMARVNRTEQLLASARAKLTPEEWEAVFDYGYSEGRD